MGALQVHNDAFVDLPLLIRGQEKNARTTAVSLQVLTEPMPLSGFSPGKATLHALFSSARKLDAKTRSARAGEGQVQPLHTKSLQSSMGAAAPRKNKNREFLLALITHGLAPIFNADKLNRLAHYGFMGQSDGCPRIVRNCSG
jgi:hypothetical protein